jgi:hypothetical protein
MPSPPRLPTVPIIKIYVEDFHMGTVNKTSMTLKPPKTLTFR